MFFPSVNNPQKRECSLCGEEKTVSRTLKVCKECIEEEFSKAKKILIQAHKDIRSPFSLPYPPPRSEGDHTANCNVCSNECVLAPGERSFCGLRENKNGKIKSKISPNKAFLYSYDDPTPTNCCASWFCPVERGYKNLAVFFYGCGFDCFFCQNSSHKRIKGRNSVHVTNLVDRILHEEKYVCVCYFGGSPEPHLPFILNLNRKILEKKKEGRTCRLCFEWNGAGNPSLVKKAARQSLRSGGIIKFDLKAPNPKLSFALSGVKNKRVFDNFEMIYDEFWHKRPNPPLLTATSLLVPGYIGPEEVEQIAKKIARIDPAIPYSLLVFHPDFKADDLPITPKKTAIKALEKAKKHLKQVHLGNKHLLSRSPSE